MEKKILIPVDDSHPSSHAVRYVTRAAAFIKDLHCILFHVQPPVSQYLREEAAVDSNVQAQLSKMLKKNEAAAQSVLNTLKTEMTTAGFPEDRIELVTRHRKLGLAQDVIEYGQKHRLDAIVVGRRGVSGIQKFFDASISEAVVERSQVIPVWLVHGDVQPDKILMAVDGSEDSLRAVDHVSFMISENPDIQVKLLHVTNTAGNYCAINLDEDPDPEFEQIIEKKDRACIDRFYPVAMKKFEEMGLKENQVSFETIKGGRRIGPTIMEHAIDNEFNTLVIGRRGIDRSFFMGSVSRSIINRISDTALWIVP